MIDKIREIKSFLSTMDEPKDIEIVINECLYHMARAITKRTILMMSERSAIRNKKFIKKLK